MKYIGTQYGAAANLLELTMDEWAALGQFLECLGVRTRMTMGEFRDGVFVVTIQGDNPYRDWLRIDMIGKTLGKADKEMTPESIAAYMR